MTARRSCAAHTSHRRVLILRARSRARAARAAASATASAAGRTAYGHLSTKSTQRSDAQSTMGDDERWENLLGLRPDGRKPEEPRFVAAELGRSRCEFADGSCELRQGLTTVIATCAGPKEAARRSDERHDRCVLVVTATICAKAVRKSTVVPRPAIESARLVHHHSTRVEERLRALVSFERNR